MPLFELTPQALVAVPTTTFAAEQVLERNDLQRLLRARPEILVDDVMVVSEEFGAFTDARRRIDLLGVDRAGHLVVIELKRTTDGGHLELQALRYAAMISAMTFEDLVEHYERHLSKLEPDAVDEARSRLALWLDEVGGEDVVLSREVRLILVAGGFDREITTTVLWLNDVYGLDIRCIRLNPYKIDDKLLLDVQQVIPLPEAGDLMIKLRRRETRARVSQTEGGRDLTQYAIITPAGRTGPLPKRRAVLALVQALVGAGVEVNKIAEALPASKTRSVEGRLTGTELTDEFRREYPQVETDPRWLRRWFFETPLHEGDRTWVLSKMWGAQTTERLEELLALAPGEGFGYEPQAEVP